MSKALLIALLAAVGCGKPSVDANTLRVGASPVPHAVILEQVKPVLREQGIDLQIVEMTDYVQPNLALVDGDLEANFFQHEAYLAEFERQKHAGLVVAGKVHIEPLGLYSRSVKTLAALGDGATIAIPNDTVNTARALALLQIAKLIEVAPVPSPTPRDITANPKKLVIRELEAAQLPRVLEDLDAAVINTNYALEAKLNPLTDALVREDGGSRYANAIVVRPQLAGDRRIKALVAALQTPAVRAFIEKRFQGAVIPAF